jgi:outer membrane protein OmpA-like peptidoglycan-associated protein
MKQILAVLLVTLFAVACVSPDDPNRRTKQGAAAGAAAGAVVGGVIGNQSGERNTGAVVGAAVGAATGAAIGRRMDQQQRELQQIEGVEVTRPAEDEIAVSLRNEILFDFDSARLRTESRRTIDQMSEVFRRYDDTTITVEGHTDSIGTDAYNQRLSEQRAQAVVDYIVGQGVPRSRLISRGYGKSRPVASNDTPEGRQRNRRVEIHVRANPQAGQ